MQTVRCAQASELRAAGQDSDPARGVEAIAVWPRERARAPPPPATAREGWGWASTAYAKRTYSANVARVGWSGSAVRAEARIGGGQIVDAVQPGATDVWYVGCCCCCLPSYVGCWLMVRVRRA
ncbi:hypothetical protein C8Q76DRAFT_725668 [Earliella scabrosa]|nr:hypothetical protein C8Q76DRAFT_725668 [Earliella scabrosa]